MAIVAWPFTAREVDFRQSLAMCPVRPQNIQSLLLKRCFLSSAVSLLSFPNFDVKSSLVAAVTTEGLVGLVDSFESFRDAGMDVEEGMGVFLEDKWDFTFQLILDLQSQ